MTKITTLADEIRSKIAQEGPKKQGKTKNRERKLPQAEIIRLIEAYDNSDHKSMVHVRFDEQTVQTMNHFKMATGVDVTRLVAFSVQRLFAEHPELKEMIKQFIQNVNL